MKRYAGAALIAIMLASAGPAKANSAANFHADVMGYINAFEMAGEAKACGLRPEKWVDEVKTNAVKNAMVIADNLWGRQTTGMPKGDGQFFLGMAMGQMDDAFTSGLKISPSGCVALFNSKALTLLDKSIGWEK